MNLGKDRRNLYQRSNKECWKFNWYTYDGRNDGTIFLLLYVNKKI